MGYYCFIEGCLGEHASKYQICSYDVKCARCGKIVPCAEAIVEEGDEWECVPCWKRCNEKERAAAEQQELPHDKG